MILHLGEKMLLRSNFLRKTEREENHNEGGARFTLHMMDTSHGNVSNILFVFYSSSSFED